MSTGLTGRLWRSRRCSVLRDRTAEVLRRSPRRTLKTAQGQIMGNSGPIASAFGLSHRQDVKGTWWMPWHQETKKDVDGCDKPRLDAEQSLTRGSPNRETRRR